MKAREFLPEEGTVSGSIATVSMPIGTLQRRTPEVSFLTKYSNMLKKRTRNARRRP
jgi:hypothetical protein